MSILVVLIPVTLLLVGIALWAFFWATNDGQFDDLDRPAVDILVDDDPSAPKTRRPGDDGT
jgi:cbb3-type cytochrome oxidase maturation protein